MVLAAAFLLASVVAASIVLRRRRHRAPAAVERFAAVNGLTLDESTRAFLRMHLARMVLFRQVGAVLGAATVFALVRGTGVAEVAAVVAAAALVLASAALLERRIAQRGIDVGDRALSTADDALRVASVNVLSSLVAALVLCAATWLCWSGRWATTAIDWNGTRVWERRGVQTYELSSTASTATVRWADTSGQHHVDLIDAPPAADPGAVSVTEPFAGRDAVLAIVGLLLVAWTFGEWLQASRAPFQARARSW